MNLHAYGKNILIELEKTESTSKGGIILAAEKEVTQNRGRIVNKGNQVSDRVDLNAIALFRKYAKQAEMKNDDKLYVIIHEDDILGFFHE